MSLGWVAIWIYRTVLTPIYPEIQASLDNVSNAEIGAIASFYFFAYCSMQIPCGILVDKFGQKIMLMAGFTLFYYWYTLYRESQWPDHDLYRVANGRWRMRFFL